MTEYVFFYFVGISDGEQMEIYQILSAILHLSNVEVKDQSADRCSILVNRLIFHLITKQDNGDF